MEPSTKHGECSDHNRMCHNQRTSAVQHFQQETEAAESLTTGTFEMELPAQLSTEENRRNIHVGLNRKSDNWINLHNIYYWTKDDVCEWLIKNNVPEQYAKILYSEDVYGASLIHFAKQDLLEIGLPLGPAVHITKMVAEFKTSSEKQRATTKDADASIGTSAAHHFQQETGAESPTTASAEVELPAQISIEENRSSIPSVKTWSDSSEEKPKCTDSELKSICSMPPFQDENVQRLEEQNNSMYKADEASGAQPLAQCTKQRNNAESETKAQLIDLEDMSKRSVYCAPRPFDESSETFEYTQNDILPPETGPSNLIDPLHEYKLLANTKDALEENVLKKFRNAICPFAAACINVRSNGTIHFGVGDKPLYKHGQIIGIEVPCRDKYVDAFYEGLKKHFKEKSHIAVTCIRPPKFVKVKCPDNKDRWVIEIDVVPKYELTQKKLFYTTLDKKEKKSKYFFIRSGANTINYLPENNRKILKQNEKKIKDDIESWALARRLAEEDKASLRVCVHRCISSRCLCQCQSGTPMPNLS